MISKIFFNKEHLDTCIRLGIAKHPAEPYSFVKRGYLSIEDEPYINLQSFRNVKKCARTSFYQSGIYIVKKNDFIVLRNQFYDVLRVTETSDVGFTAALLDNCEQYYCFTDQKIDNVFQDEEQVLYYSTNQRQQLSEDMKNLRPGI